MAREIRKGEKKGRRRKPALSPNISKSFTRRQEGGMFSIYSLALI
jgi:hypothetical protein